jgi:hypothetical protein
METRSDGDTQSFQTSGSFKVTGSFHGRRSFQYSGSQQQSTNCLVSVYRHTIVMSESIQALLHHPDVLSI